MFEFIVRRVAQGLLVMLVALSVAFALMYGIGDPVISIIGPDADPATIEQMRRVLGLDRPIAVQYVDFLVRAVQGDFGVSTRYRQPVFPLMMSRLRASAELAIPAFFLAGVASLGLGVVSALRRNQFIDYAARALALFGQSAPAFWVAIMLIVYFSLHLGWLPASGRGTVAHAIMPIFVISLWPLAYLTRIVRSSMLDVLSEDYVRTARGKGLPERRVLFGHALRNALLPFITVLSMQFASFVAGSMMVETVFAYPGLGRLMLNAIRQLDIPLVAGSIALTAGLAVLMNLIADILYAVADPRVRKGA